MVIAQIQYDIIAPFAEAMDAKMMEHDETKGKYYETEPEWSLRYKLCKCVELLNDCMAQRPPDIDRSKKLLIDIGNYSCMLYSK